MLEFKLKPIVVGKKTRSDKESSLVTRVCKYCGKEFQVRSWYGTGDYCSKQCSSAAKKVTHENNTTCCVCGKEYYCKPSQKLRNKTGYFCCSRVCAAELKKTLYAGVNNPNFGNRLEHIVEYNNGFKYFKVHVDNHPYADYQGCIKEHRFIVEQNYHLFDKKYFIIIDGKYYLKPSVDVHHKNEITTDNRIENLEPLTRSEHTSHHNNEKEIIRDSLGRIAGVLKQGELLESHSDNDNQHPSINSNINEGSTTNIRVQTDNAEDSNDDTSALPHCNNE